MIELLRTSRYVRWFKRLRDAEAKAAIADYFFEVEMGAPLNVDGDAPQGACLRYLGDKVVEAKFDYGQGIRVYLTQEGREVVLLLAGGDKSTQRKDIADAKRMAREWRRERGYGHR